MSFEDLIKPTNSAFDWFASLGLNLLLAVVFALVAHLAANKGWSTVKKDPEGDGDILDFGSWSLFGRALIVGAIVPLVGNIIFTEFLGIGDFWVAIVMSTQFLAAIVAGVFAEILYVLVYKKTEQFLSMVGKLKQEEFKIVYEKAKEELKKKYENQPKESPKETPVEIQEGPQAPPEEEKKVDINLLEGLDKAFGKKDDSIGTV